MAKMKQFAVEIEYTVKETIYVTARRPNGAAEKALTQEAYREAHMYDCGSDECCDCGSGRFLFVPDNATVTKVREA